MTTTCPACGDSGKVQRVLSRGPTIDGTAVCKISTVVCPCVRARDLEAELLRVRTVGHGAAHELDNIAVELGLGHSPQAGVVAAEVRRLKAAEQRVVELEAALAEKEQARLDAVCKVNALEGMEAQRRRSDIANRLADGETADDE